MPDFLHAFLVRNMESGIDRTKRFYSFIAAQDHPLAEGWTSSMKVVLLKVSQSTKFGFQKVLFNGIKMN